MIYDNLPFKMVIFRSYVEKPEGNVCTQHGDFFHVLVFEPPPTSSQKFKIQVKRMGRADRAYWRYPLAIVETFGDLGLPHPTVA